MELRGAGLELDGTALDLAEAGLLVAVPACGRPPGTHVAMQVRVLLTSGTLDAEVQLLRRSGRARDLDEWALGFTRLGFPARRLLRTHVLSSLRDHRCRGLL